MGNIEIRAEPLKFIKKNYIVIVNNDNNLLADGTILEIIIVDFKIKQNNNIFVFVSHNNVSANK